MAGRRALAPFWAVVFTLACGDGSGGAGMDAATGHDAGGDRSDGAPDATARDAGGVSDGGGADAGSPPDFELSGPVVLTTSDMLRDAYERVRARREPFHGAWERVKGRADGSLDSSYAPYDGTDHGEYFRTARGQALVARASALAFRLTEDPRYLERTRTLLLTWAEAGDAYPFSLPEIDHSAGLVLGRMAVVFADAYALVHHALSSDERDTVEAWLASWVPVIQESRRIWVEESLSGHPAPYLGRQYFNNHLGAHTMGMLAIGYASGDDALVRHALSGEDNTRDLDTLFDGVIVMDRGDLYEGDPTLTEGRPDPLPGEIFDRYRIVEGHGLHYSHLHLRLLTLMALMAHNNGETRDYFDYTGPDGERLLLSYEVYAQFLVSGRTGDRTGYYADDTAVEFKFLTLLEIGNRFHPGRDAIVRALEARDRVFHDQETFGWTAPLVHGRDDIENHVGRWEFERDGDREGWRVRKSLSMSTTGGHLVLDVTGTDPAIMSPDRLRLPAEQYDTLTLRMKNETPDELCQVFFVTDEAPSYSADRRVSVALTPDDDGFREYAVDLGSHGEWTGTIRQLRIDVVSDGPGGRVLVDAIRLE